MADIETFRLLQTKEPDRAEVEALFAKRSNEMLLGAWANPDHSDRARRILAEMASARGLHGEEDDGWMMAESSMFVKPFGPKPTFEEALAAPGKRRRLYRTLQASALLPLVLLIVLIAMATSQSQAPDSTLNVVVFFGFLIGALAWCFGGIFSWTRPVRMLLLRPFQSRKVSGALKRFVRKNMAFHGHTFLLSDRYVKESKWIYIMSFVPRSPVDIAIILVFFIPYFRQLKPWLNVTNVRRYRFLQTRLQRRFTLNSFWIQSFRKLNRIKCSDTWWRQTVDLLMYNTQVIVVDLSWVKSGTEWELGKIHARQLENKTLFVVAADKAEYAQEVIRHFWPDRSPPPLHQYDAAGRVANPDAYNRDMARIISTSHLWSETGPQGAH